MPTANKQNGLLSPPPNRSLSVLFDSHISAGSTTTSNRLRKHAALPEATKERKLWRKCCKFRSKCIRTKKFKLKTA
jgi:hypothetical protein